MHKGNYQSLKPILSSITDFITEDEGHLFKGQWVALGPPCPPQLRPILEHNRSWRSILVTISSCVLDIEILFS